MEILNSILNKTLNKLLTYSMSLSKKHPSKTVVMQKADKSGFKEKPFRRKEKSFHGMKNSQEMVTKVIH